MFSHQKPILERGEQASEFVDDQKLYHASVTLIDVMDPCRFKRECAVIEVS